MVEYLLIFAAIASVCAFGAAFFRTMRQAMADHRDTAVRRMTTTVSP